MSNRGAKRSWGHAMGALVAAVAVMILFHVGGTVFFKGYELDLGRITIPGPRYARFVAIWFGFGTAAAGFLAAALALFRGPRPQPGVLGRIYRWIPDWLWVGSVMVVAFAVPVAIRALVLRDVPIVDDEHPYRFMAQLLARGDLWADSPPIAEAFDRKFMVNWGKFYSQYFLGWPALMVPAVWVGWPDYANAAYASLTVLPVFFVIRRHTNSSVARIVSLVYLAAPMLMLGAATAMAHTTCLAGLAFMHWAVLRSTDEDSPWWSHAAVAFLFGLTFFNRPTPAIGGGIPLLLYWFAHVVRRPRGQALAAVGMFMVPAVAMGGLFLGVNYLQNGAPFKSAYARAIEFAHLIGFREWGGPRREGIGGFFRSLSNPPALFATIATAVFRLNASLFGWPCSYLFAALAVGRRDARLSVAMFLGLFAIHSFVISVGVDTFGPVKYFEAGWPVLVLTGIGLHRSINYLEELEPAEGWSSPVRMQFVPVAVVLALIATSLVGYTRIRLKAFKNIGDSINIPMDALREADIHGAVVFAPGSFSPRKCSRKPTGHFLYQQPMNNPDFSNDVLWANDRGRGFDLKVMELFPDRLGYVMRWTKDCKVTFEPLEVRPRPAPPKKRPPKPKAPPLPPLPPGAEAPDKAGDSKSARPAAGPRRPKTKEVKPSAETPPV